MKNLTFGSYFKPEMLRWGNGYLDVKIDLDRLRSPRSSDQRFEDGRFSEDEETQQTNKASKTY